MSVTGKNVIGFEFSSQGERVFHAINPETNEELPMAFHQATDTEIEAAVAMAKAAFFDYSTGDIFVRCAFLKAIADRILLSSSKLTHSFCLETGLPMNRAESELKRAAFQFISYADAIDYGYALEVKIDEGLEHQSGIDLPDLRKMNVALGPVVVFGASNFPFAYSTIGGDVASALAAGCPVIVKAHAMHPYTSELSAQIIRDVCFDMGMPEGVFSHLNGIDYTVGEKLVSHPSIKAVGFTGSIKGGMALHELAQKRKQPIPVFAEMGSSNPIFITEKALAHDPADIAIQIANSVNLNAGQFCTSPGLCFVVKSEGLTRFLSEMKGVFKKAQEQTMLHPGIFAQYDKAANDQEERTTVLTNGKRQANKITPSLVQCTDEEFRNNPEIGHEVFGSFMTIVVCETEERMFENTDILEGQLTASIFHHKEQIQTQLLRLGGIAGRIIVNGVPTGVTVSYAMQHGGPFPSSNQTDSSVGWDAIKRFMRPVSFQNVTDANLPKPLKSANPLGILRFVNGIFENKRESNQ